MAEADFLPTADHPQAASHAATSTPSMAGTGPTAGDGPEFDDAPLTALPGFDIEKVIGVGGMGEVYLAKQQGLNRPVAIKTVRSRVRDKQLIRFLAEAEAVAAVRHPNVVEVYQFGEHLRRPYLVLEFCPGGDLSTHISDAPADRPRWAADLMAAIADGVGAAHALGIVHRDLKPANVLIAADGTPKVTDFGLAKRVGSGSELTQTDAILGTPAYMSPEQAGGGTKFVGPEGDVWSLGVILYELVSGQRPFTADNALQLVSRVMGGEVPPLRSKCPTVPADLALIVHKCLSREPRERYATANELAADLRRWLAGEPILARPPGAVETAVRWARRNPRVAGSVAAAVLALVVGTVVSTGLALFALSEAKRADGEAATAREQKRIAVANAEEAARERVRADEEAVRAKVSGELTTFLREVFGTTDPTGLSSSGLLPPADAGRKVTAEKLLARGMELIDKERFRGGTASERLTRAALLDALGDAARSLGMYDKAGPLLKEAVAVRDELLPAGHPDRRRSRYNLSCFYGESGDPVASEAVFTALLAEHRADGTGETAAAADVCYRLAGVYMVMEDKRAVPLAAEAVRIREKVFPDKHRQTALARLVLAAAYFNQAKAGDGLAAMKPALEVFVADGVADEPVVRAAIEYQTALLMRQGGFTSRAVTHFTACLNTLRETLGPDHLYLALPLADLGLTHRAAGRWAEAEASLDAAVAQIRKTVGLGYPKAITLVHAYALVLARAGKKDKGWAVVREMLEASEKRFGPDTPWRVRLLATAAAAAVVCDRPAEAADLTRQTLAEYRRRPAHHDILDDLGGELSLLADLTPCRQVYAALFATPDALWTPAERWRQKHNFACGLVDHRRYDEAEPLLRDTCGTIDAQEVREVGAEFRTFSLVRLGEVEWHAGRHAEAEKLFRAAVAMQEKAGGVEFTRRRYGTLIRLLAVRRDYPAVAPLAAKYAKLSGQQDTDRGWAVFLRAATAGEGDRTAAGEAVEPSLGKATDPDPVAFRARAVVVSGGDVGREAARLDTLLSQGKGGDHLSLARAACAVALGQSPERFLKHVTSSDRPVLVRVRDLLAALAAHREKPTDQTRAALEVELGRADEHLTAAAGTDPEVKGFVVAYLVELNWWAERVRAELKTGKR